MQLSPKGLKFLAEQESEGGVPRLRAYLDTGGVWTIGFGHIRGVEKGDSCTEQQAFKWLADESSEAAQAVNRLVPRELTQNQFDALVSFVFNIGIDAFRTSRMRAQLLENMDELAALQFARWKYDNGKEIEGLKNRRAREKELFITP